MADPTVITESDVVRFWAKVKIGSPEECWPWTAGKDADGYGRFRFVEGTARAHRVALIISTGKPIPPGMDGCHHCDNPPCCNPNPGHLYIDTGAGNTADKVAKGRQAKGPTSGRYTKPERTARGERHMSKTHPEALRRGAAHPMTKVTPGLAEAVRFLLDSHLMTWRMLAKALGLSIATLSRIRKPDHWTRHTKGRS